MNKLALQARVIPLLPMAIRLAYLQLRGATKAEKELYLNGDQLSNAHESTSARKFMVPIFLFSASPETVNSCQPVSFVGGAIAITWR